MNKKHAKKGKKLKIFINSSRKKELLLRVQNDIIRNDQITLFTPNPEFVVLADKDEAFLSILNQSKYNVPDGSYLFWAKYIQDKRQRVQSWNRFPSFYRTLRLCGWGALASAKIHFGNLSKNRITGADFMFDICRMASHKNWGVFFLGGAEGVAQKAAKKLKTNYPKLKVVGTYAGDGSKNGDRDVLAAIKKISKGRKIHIIFVAYGMGKQEKWVARNQKKLGVNLAMGVGGSFDYLVKLKRAPKAFQNRGLEWLYRLFQEPKRMARQIKLLKYLWMILTEKAEIKFVN